MASRHGKKINSGMTNYRRKAKGLNTGGSDASKGKKKRTWWEQGVGASRRKVAGPLPCPTTPIPSE